MREKWCYYEHTWKYAISEIPASPCVDQFDYRLTLTLTCTVILAAT